jgi:hypothetical protein
MLQHEAIDIQTAPQSFDNNVSVGTWLAVAQRIPQEPVPCRLIVDPLIPDFISGLLCPDLGHIWPKKHMKLNVFCGNRLADEVLNHGEDCTKAKSFGCKRAALHAGPGPGNHPGST